METVTIIFQDYWPWIAGVLIVVVAAALIATGRKK